MVVVAVEVVAAVLMVSDNGNRGALCSEFPERLDFSMVVVAVELVAVVLTVSDNSTRGALNFQSTLT